MCKSERSRGWREIRNYVKGGNGSEISGFYCLLGNEINTQCSVGNVSGKYRGKVSLTTKGINPQVCCSGQNVGPASGAAGLASRRAKKMSTLTHPPPLHLLPSPTIDSAWWQNLFAIFSIFDCENRLGRLHIGIPSAILTMTSLRNWVLFKRKCYKRQDRERMSEKDKEKAWKYHPSCKINLT